MAIDPLQVAVVNQTTGLADEDFARGPGLDQGPGVVPDQGLHDAQIGQPLIGRSTHQCAGPAGESQGFTDAPRRAARCPRPGPRVAA